MGFAVLFGAGMITARHQTEKLLKISGSDIYVVISFKLQFFNYPLIKNGKLFVTSNGIYTAAVKAELT